MVKHSIVVYEGADSPATMALSDTIAGVGCVGRDTVQYTGVDVIISFPDWPKELRQNNTRKIYANKQFVRYNYYGHYSAN